MTNKEKREIADLLRLAADLAVARTKLDPAWPTWRKVAFWKSLDPAITRYTARAKDMTGQYVTL